MMGRNHVLVGSTLAAGGLGIVRGVAVATAGFENTMPVAGPVITTVVTAVGDGARWLLGWLVPGGPSLWYGLAAIALFLLGTYLPDIDSKSSKLGRWVKFPGPHHGFMHSDWFTVALIALACWEPLRLMAFVALGVWLHHELDGWSRAGRARWFPLGRWKTIELPDEGGDCVVLKNPRVINYRVGSKSELTAVGIFLAIGVGLLLGAYFLDPGVVTSYRGELGF